MGLLSSDRHRSSLVRNSIWMEAAALLRRLVFGALRCFRVAILRRRALAGPPPPLERRFIRLPKARSIAPSQISIKRGRVNEFGRGSLSGRSMLPLGQTLRSQSSPTAQFVRC